MMDKELKFLITLLGTRVRRTTETIAVDVLNWEEAEDTTGLEGTADVVDELIVPRYLNWVVRFGDDGGTSRVEKAFRPNFWRPPRLKQTPRTRMTFVKSLPPGG